MCPSLKRSTKYSKYSSCNEMKMNCSMVLQNRALKCLFVWYMAYLFNEFSNFRTPYVVRPVHMAKFNTSNFRFWASALQTGSFKCTCSKLSLRSCRHFENSCTNESVEITAILKSKYCSRAKKSF